MKKGRSDRTGMFGSDAEHYASRLFMMMRNPNGTRRPDLISIDNRFDPRLSIEVKSGAEKKGVLNKEQLHYAITTWKDYVQVFGEDMGLKDGLFEEEELKDPKAIKVAYYYDVVNRVDGLTSNDVDLPFSSVKLKWGDQYIVPHELAFYVFAVARVMRTKECVENVIEELRQVMKEDALHAEDTDYETRRDSQAWQNLNGRDILAIFNKDCEIATKYGKQRIEMLAKVYPDLNHLERVLIPAPNSTSIYVLSNPENYDLFDKQLRETVQERIPVLEAITKEREESLCLLGRFEESHDFFSGNGHPKEKYKIITADDKIKLKRLTQWLAEGESPLDLIPF